jgi:polyisoprenoid-binding protein YceI
MRSGFLNQRACVVAVIGLLAVAQAEAESRPIDAEHSTLTVFAYKSGMFSAFADNHVISASIAHGTISEGAPRAIEIVVRSADLRVLDPDLAPDRRAEVQARMLGSEVLDVAKFSEITFVSTTIEPAGADRWKVAGRLTIHGQTRVITLSVALLKGKYSGEVLIKQHDFGIEPIKVAGGTVKVKDELKIQFEIAR